nr:hypothetical protein CFP56_56949 [Quercus suber]
MPHKRVTDVRPPLVNPRRHAPRRHECEPSVSGWLMRYAYRSAGGRAKRTAADRQRISLCRFTSINPYTVGCSDRNVCRVIVVAASWHSVDGSIQQLLVDTNLNEL